jgi:hypothetical protein
VQALVTLPQVEPFEDYMADLETGVLAAAVGSSLLGRRETLPVRPGKLARTGFGARIGMAFESHVSFAVDYYGHLKRSTSLLKEIEWLKEQLSGRQIKTIECIVVHFAAVRIEYVAKFSPELVSGFPMFKKAVLEARGFKTKF